MPLAIRRDEKSLSAWSGRFYVGGAGLHDVGPRPFWAWGVTLAQARGGTDKPDAAISHIEAAWRCWLARAALVEGAAGLSAPLRVVFAVDQGIEAAHPNSDYIVFSGGLTVGALEQDPWRNVVPGVIRPPSSPWHWLLHQDYGTNEGRLWGGCATRDAAEAAITAHWNRWLAYARLGPA